MYSSSFSFFPKTPFLSSHSNRSWPLLVLLVFGLTEGVGGGWVGDIDVRCETGGGVEDKGRGDGWDGMGWDGRGTEVCAAVDETPID